MVLDTETIRWMIGLCVVALLALLGGMAGLIKMMVVGRVRAMEANMTAQFLDVRDQNRVLQKKLEEFHVELSTKIDDVREDVHELDKRIFVIERDHERASQNGFCRFTEGGS